MKGSLWLFVLAGVVLYFFFTNRTQAATVATGITAGTTGVNAGPGNPLVDGTGTLGATLAGVFKTVTGQTGTSQGWDGT